MEPIALFRIASLHVRMDGTLNVEFGGQEVPVGPVVATLDETASYPTNLALLDLATRIITLRWAVTATVPFLADAFARDLLPDGQGDSVRVWFEETGQLDEDGSGFSAYGPGEVAPGSLFAGVTFPQSNFVRFAPKRTTRSLARATTSGTPVRCVFDPASFLDVNLPERLGGASGRMTLVGGFTLVPTMVLPRTLRSGRRRR